MSTPSDSVVGNSNAGIPEGHGQYPAGPPQAGLGMALTGLTDVLKEMNLEKVPPPATFGGNDRVEDFFVEFENYCKSIYKKESSYLAVLPSFLEGEPRQMVEAFGRGPDVTYNVVKNRLIRELKEKKGLTGDAYAEFFSIQRHPGESLRCFLIRLETSVKRIRGITAAGELSMVRSKLIDSLPPSMVQQIRIQMSHMEVIGVEQIVRMASILEEQKPTMVAVLHPREQPTNDSRSEVNRVQTQTYTRNRTNNSYPRGGCYNCGEDGHFVRECPKKNEDGFKGYSRGWDSRGRGGYRGRGNRGGRFNEGRGYVESNQSQGPSASEQHEEAGRVICMFCGQDGHAFADCVKFKETFLRCAHCGALEHVSYQCPTKGNPGNV